jgi:hypothetical protein
VFISLINYNPFYLFIYFLYFIVDLGRYHYIIWIDGAHGSFQYIGMHDAKKICVRLFVSVTICFIVIIIFSTFFIQMSTTHLYTYPWTTSTANRYNGRPTSEYK